MKNVRTICLFALAGLLFSCNQKPKSAQAPDPLAQHIDSTVSPGADFFHFANGRWFKENPIPDSEQSNGLWQMIQDTINAQVRQICERSAALKDAPKGSNKQKIGDFFYSGMDSAGIQQRGLSDLKERFAQIDAAADVAGLLRQAAYIHAASAAPLFNFTVRQDDRNSSKYAVFIGQGGLSMPDRNFYFDTDAQAIDIRKKFVAHLQNMFLLMDNDQTKAAQAARSVMSIETALAKASRKREDTRDPLLNYNKMTFQALQKSTPNIDWAVFFTEVGLPAVDSVVVEQPEFLQALNRLLPSTPPADWKNYLRYQFVRGLARYLDDKTYLESFSFYNTTLRGIKEPRPRWKRVVQETNTALGELIGQVYVDEYLPKGSKEKLLEIGEAIREVYARRIQELDWMSAATKEKALKKLKAIIMKVGYPDKWKDMSALEIDRNSYVLNRLRANQWAYRRQIAKFGKPVDRTEWEMQPQTYNAYYNPSNNEIVVPGCNILVPGYEGRLADDAILYSIIGGSTFGHEITHGFDDQGSKYDEFGNLNNWWTPEDSAQFSARTRRIVEQFNAYVAVDSLHINGELTQGENIADLGGIVMGYEAFKKRPQYLNKEIIGGLNPDQRFFLGYALAWMINDRPEGIASQVRSNEHSPAQFRVIGPLVNMPEFYATFGVKKGDPLWREEESRIRIW